MDVDLSPEQYRELLTEAYTDRNLLAQLLAWLAFSHGWLVCWMDDPAEPEWPVLAIELPTGQITYHIPRAEAIYTGEIPHQPNRWDGHSAAQKRDRIRRLIEPLAPEKEGT